MSSLPPTRPPAPPALQRVPDPEVDEWAEKINRASSNGVEWLLSAGMHLKLAKAALDPGRWKGMFDSGKIKMGLRSAEMLMRIAGHSALAVTEPDLEPLRQFLLQQDAEAGATGERL